MEKSSNTIGNEDEVEAAEKSRVDVSLVEFDWIFKGQSAKSFI